MTETEALLGEYATRRADAALGLNWLAMPEGYGARDYYAAMHRHLELVQSISDLLSGDISTPESSAEPGPSAAQGVAKNFLRWEQSRCVYEVLQTPIKQQDERLQPMRRLPGVALV
jgi:hypothetical protein